MVPRREERFLQAHYFQGNTSNTFFFDLSYRGNPGNYQSFAWGWSDACVGETNSLYEQAGYPDLPRARYDGLVGQANSSIQSFRDLAPVNSYAETAPGITFDELTATGTDRSGPAAHTDRAVRRVLLPG